MPLSLLLNDGTTYPSSAVIASLYPVPAKLVGLFKTKADGATAALNKRTNASGTVNGAPAYGEHSTIFSGAAYIDTKIAGSAGCTLGIIARQQAAASVGIGDYIGGSDHTAGDGLLLSGTSQGAYAAATAHFAGDASPGYYNATAQFGAAAGDFCLYLACVDAPAGSPATLWVGHGGTLTKTTGDAATHVPSGRDILIGTGGQTGSGAIEIACAFIFDAMLTDAEAAATYAWAQAYAADEGITTL